MFKIWTYLSIRLLFRFILERLDNTQPVLNVDWISQSIKEKAQLPFEDFLVKPLNHHLVQTPDGPNDPTGRPVEDLALASTSDVPVADGSVSLDAASSHASTSGPSSDTGHSRCEAIALTLDTEADAWAEGKCTYRAAVLSKVGRKTFTFLFHSSRRAMYGHPMIPLPSCICYFSVWYGSDYDENKPVWPTWAVGVLSRVRDFETYNYGRPS
jgi:hypothetical protein